MQSANMTFYFEKRSSDITYSQKRKQVKGYLCCKISESNITLSNSFTWMVLLHLSTYLWLLGLFLVGILFFFFFFILFLVFFRRVCRQWSGQRCFHRAKFRKYIRPSSRLRSFPLLQQLSMADGLNFEYKNSTWWEKKHRKKYNRKKKVKRT